MPPGRRLAPRCRRGGIGGTLLSLDLRDSPRTPIRGLPLRWTGSRGTPSLSNSVFVCQYFCLSVQPSAVLRLSPDAGSLAAPCRAANSNFPQKAAAAGQRASVSACTSHAPRAPAKRTAVATSALPMPRRLAPGSTTSQPIDQRGPSWLPARTSATTPTGLDSVPAADSAEWPRAIHAHTSRPGRHMSSAARPVGRRAIPASAVGAPPTAASVCRSSKACTGSTRSTTMPAHGNAGNPATGSSNLTTAMEAL